jgi:uncharacterized protein YggE
MNRGTPRARRCWPLLLLLLLLAACTRPPDAADWPTGAPGSPAARTLTVIGTGRFVAPPTRAEVDAWIQTESPAPEVAWQQGAERLYKLTRALEAAGLRPSDMQPIDAVLHGTGTTYVVVQRLRITVHDLQRMPNCLATALGHGATSLEGLRYSLDGRAPGDRARERALLDAGDKARMLAQELQVRLGSVHSVEELSSSSPTEVGTVQEPPPPLETVSSLRVSYSLLD